MIIESSVFMSWQRVVYNDHLMIWYNDKFDYTSMIVRNMKKSYNRVHDNFERRSIMIKYERFLINSSTNYLCQVERQNAFSQKIQLIDSKHQQWRMNKFIDRLIIWLK